mgnify:CR=1 FL=1
MVNIYKLLNRIIANKRYSLSPNLFIEADRIELSEEERRIAEKFNEDLRKKIIDDLVKCEINEIINVLKSDEENFKAKLADILINGKKGYINMPTKTLIDIYLDKSNEVDFIKLIESIR